MRESSGAAARTIESLGHAEKIEGLSRRLPLPHCPEFELSYFSRVHFETLRRALTQAQRRDGPGGAATRGRLLRLLGDPVGARRELEAAVGAGDPLGLLWLGELCSGTAEGEDLLVRAAARLPGNPWPALHLGSSLLARGEARRAAAPLAEFVRRRPGSGIGRILLGVSRQLGGDEAGAIRDYAAASRVQPNSPVPHLLRARLLPLGPAARACEDAFDAEPEYAHVAMYEYEVGGDWPSYLRGLVRYIFQPKRSLSLSARFLEDDIKILPYHYEYVRWAEDLLKEHPDRTWTWGLLGRALARCPPASGLQARGVEALNKAVRLGPDRGWVYGWRGLALIVNKRPREALRDLDECLRRQPYYCWAYEWRGALLHSFGRERAALIDLDRAASTNQHYPFSLNRRSHVKRALRDWTGAAHDLDEAFRLDMRYAWVFPTGREASARELSAGVAELTRAIRRAPTTASLRTWRGQTRLQQRDYPRAFRDFEGALALDPAHALSQAWYGKGLTEAGRPAEACARLRRAVELAPDRWVYRLWLADALRQSGGEREALTLLDKVLADRPRAWWAWQTRARVLLDLGRPREALFAARRAISFEGRNADNYYLEADALRRLGRPRAAEASVDRLLAISAHFGRAWILRAEIRAARGKTEESIADYRHALERFPYLFNDAQRARLAALLGEA